MAHPFKRDRHPAWLEREKLADGGTADDKPTFGNGGPGAWDYFKAGAKDQIDNFKSMARGDFRADPLGHTKAVYETDKRK